MEVVPIALMEVVSTKGAAAVADPWVLSQKGVGVIDPRPATTKLRAADKALRRFIPTASKDLGPWFSAFSSVFVHANESSLRIN